MLMSLSRRFLFTSDPRGTLKLWRLFNPLPSVSYNVMRRCCVSLIAEFRSCFGMRIMCLDASAENEVNILYSSCIVKFISQLFLLSLSLWLQICSLSLLLQTCPLWLQTFSQYYSLFCECLCYFLCRFFQSAHFPKMKNEKL